jgi:hypothetical protein
MLLHYLVTKLQQDFYLGVEYERAWLTFWLPFVAEVEKRLAAARISGRGFVADGDLPIVGCRYASLRNEAFVQARKDGTPSTDGPLEYIYPPNSCGWNAAAHQTPH